MTPDLLRRIRESASFDPARGIRTLSVRQPWAWAILHAGKDVENRSWATNVRGTIAIHASRSAPLPGDLAALRERGLRVPAELPLGAVVGLVDLVDCVEGARSRWAERDKRHWILANPVAFADPRPASGAVGFWYWRVGVDA